MGPVDLAYRIARVRGRPFRGSVSMFVPYLMIHDCLLDGNPFPNVGTTVI